MRSWLNGYGVSENWGGASGTDYSNDSFIGDAFAAKEQPAILETDVKNSKTDTYTPNPDYSTEGGNDTMDKVFLLSLAEAVNTTYGFTDNNSRRSTNTAYVTGGGKIGSSGMYDVGKSDIWWVRSPGQYLYTAARVFINGSVNTDGDNVYNTGVAVRPAFNLNLGSVLFISAAAGGKAGDVGVLSEIGGYSGKEWKLTLLDDSRRGEDGFQVMDTVVYGAPGSTVTLTYGNATVGNNEYISAILADGDGSLLCYGRLALAQSGSDNTLIVTIPSGLADGTYTLKVFNEQYNGGEYDDTRLTDYASDFSDVKLTVNSGESVWWDYNENTKTLYISDEANKGNDYALFTIVEQRKAAANDEDLPWVEKCVQAVVIQGKPSPATTANWFFGQTELTEIQDLAELNTSFVTDMHNMFRSCELLDSLDLSTFDMDQVTDVSSMFFGCEALDTLDTSGWDTGSVEDMACMFYGCSGFTGLDLSHFKTGSVTEMVSMFEGCSKLADLKISGFDTSQVTDMTWMFAGCAGLTSLDLSPWDTGNVKEMDHMFEYCCGLTELDLSFSTDNLSNTARMFSGCTALTTIYASVDADWSSTFGINMFDGCTSLVGGEDTAYDSGYIDQNYARIDDPYNGKPGYFTVKQTQTYTVTVNADPTEGGTVTGGGEVPAGESVTVTAREGDEYAFEGWYNVDKWVSDEAEYTFTPAGDIDLKAKFVRTYPLWIGATRVTAGNKDNIPSVTGDGAKASFDPDTNTLTLENVTGIIGSSFGALITAEGIDLTIRGDADLNRQEEIGIQVAPGSLTINGKFSISGGSYGLYVQKDVNITGGKIDISPTYAYGVYAARGKVDVTGGTLSAQGQISAIEATGGIS
jgi:surface protein